MQDYIIEPLCRAGINSAYPLVYLTAPGLGLAAWRRQARSAIDSRAQGARGILVVRRQLRQHLCGMIWYRSEYDLICSKTLAAHNFIVIDILDPRGIVLQVLNALITLARAQGCSRVKLVLPSSASLAAAMQSAIHQFELTSSFANCTEFGFPL